MNLRSAIFPPPRPALARSHGYPSPEWEPDLVVVVSYRAEARGVADFDLRAGRGPARPHKPSQRGSTPRPATTFLRPVIRPAYLHARGNGREGTTTLDVDRHAPGDSREETGNPLSCGRRESSASNTSVKLWTRGAPGARPPHARSRSNLPYVGNRTGNGSLTDVTTGNPSQNWVSGTATPSWQVMGGGADSAAALNFRRKATGDGRPDCLASGVCGIEGDLLQRLPRAFSQRPGNSITGPVQTSPAASAADGRTAGKTAGVRSRGSGVRQYQGHGMAYNPAAMRTSARGGHGAQACNGPSATGAGVNPARDPLAASFPRSTPQAHVH